MLAAAAVLAAALPASARGTSTAAPAGPDVAARTPAAAPGTAAASRRGISASRLGEGIAKAMAGVGGASGVWVRDLEGAGGPLYEQAAAKRRIPASNQKLFTTAAFLDRLGADASLETTVYARGRLRGPGGSVLSGDLVIRGDGDPAFGTARFARAHDQPVARVSNLAGDIARAGIRRVSGRILADDTIFDRARRDGPYLSPLSGLSFNNGYEDGEYARAPELAAARALKNALRKRGVEVARGIGRANLTATEAEREPLGSVESPSVASLIEETNVPSNNFFAEMLLKRLGAASGKRGTRNRGARLIERFARGEGVALKASDGSGLSRRNRVSPAHVGRLLVALASDPEDSVAFRDSLPVAGREGTLAERMRGTAAEGKCAAKTGTLREVTALSGYCETGGRTIAFSILMNGVNVDAGRRAQDRIAALIARYAP